MAVPDRCKDVEKKFQDEVKTFPDLPANIQIQNNVPSWNFFKDLVTSIARGHHEAHVRLWRWMHVTDLYMYDNFYPEIMKYLCRYINCEETDPFMEVIKQYALRVNDAHNAVINCIRLNQPKVMVPEMVPEIKIPAGQEDIISMTAIPDGTRMVDFHGERAKHRYYTEATYNALNPKKNPYTRQAIEPNQVTRYIAKLDSTLPVQEAGRRKTRKYKRRARKTRRHHK